MSVPIGGLITTPSLPLEGQNLVLDPNNASQPQKTQYKRSIACLNWLQPQLPSYWSPHKTAKDR